MVTVGIHENDCQMNTSCGEVTVTRTPAGTPKAPTLLLIHGFLDDASVWDGLVDSLGGEVASVRYDLPGFGTRTASAGDASVVTLESLAAEAGDILADIDGPVIVVGQSLGTQVAELVAARHQQHVRGLVLLTPVPLGGTQLPEDVVASFRALGGDRDAQRAVRAELSPHISEERLDQLADVGVPAAVEVVCHYVDLWNLGVSNAPASSAFDGPVLIIRGGADTFVTEQLVGIISPRFAHTEVTVIDEGGHWVHVEYPWAVAAIVLDFADSIVGVAP
jgi:pimeloyl-ACP methyl ester carboxylesterase